MHNIVKSLIYSFLRTLMNVSMAFSYRNIIVTGYDKIKNSMPALFVSNHQNTFMDGLVLVKVGHNIRPNILVRADIFKSKWASIALDIIRLIPIYRKKDNMGSVAQNNEIFKKCIDLFKKGEPLLIFPEGNHAIKRFLRPIQKGPARIAFQAEEGNNFQLGLNVVPFGLHYERHPKRWHDLHVHFGDAFKVSDFQKVYEENPTKANKQFNDKIRKDISAEMVDIQWHAEYEFMEHVRTLLKPYAMKWAENKKSIVHAENEVVNRIAYHLQENEDLTSSLKENTNNYFREVNKNKLSEDFKAKKPTIVEFLFKAIGILIGLPFWIIAKVINFIPEFIIEKKVIAGVKDITWHISLRTGISMFLYPIYYLLIFIVLGFSIGWIIAGITVFTFPLISVVMYETEYHYKKLRNAFILFKKPEIIKQEQELVKEFKGLFV
ncbi:1-acyl-sn-glycerol-3-phosphate acyltransferase [Marivirga salinae]|uniref:1-acyl-sn-glycerol-3-phosphate acyltransferase n=1 Tax=Marivirga salinarum TaxID=3059078 RepID=A0AA51NDZ9_9BACT|nr:1-acyl-sn-glycerol-3-phosphate acyltransferase [Marivirga sp. BDSF4-3]WMN12130.1 1-acyl-sn-glycerol-3-phosphate acyltransferase [Marivirga sp. BDSF4-3]